MSIPELAVRRPVSALMITLICVVLGVIALVFLKIELMPDLSFPVAAVITKYEGASSEDVETRVTKLVEAAVSRTKALIRMKSWRSARRFRVEYLPVM